MNPLLPRPTRGASCLRDLYGRRGVFLGSFTGFTYTSYALMAQEKETCALVLVGRFWLFNLENSNTHCKWRVMSCDRQGWKVHQERYLHWRMQHGFSPDFDRVWMGLTGCHGWSKQCFLLFHNEQWNRGVDFWKKAVSDVIYASPTRCPWPDVRSAAASTESCGCHRFIRKVGSFSKDVSVLLCSFPGMIYITI